MIILIGQAELRKAAATEIYGFYQLSSPKALVCSKTACCNTLKAGCILYSSVSAYGRAFGGVEIDNN